MTRRVVLSPAEQEAQEVFASAKAAREDRAARVEKMKARGLWAKPDPKPGEYIDREMRNERR